MFCPKCAAQNVDGASFCRVCGANISLIPQALSGQLPEAPAPEGEPECWPQLSRRRKGAETSLERGIVNLFMGLGFIVAALVITFRLPGGFTWGWAFFIPASAMLGRGIASIVANSKQQAAPVLPGAASGTRLNPATNRQAATQTSRLNTGELMPVAPSVTEGTTRHLGIEAQTRHLES